MTLSIIAIAFLVLFGFVAGILTTGFVSNHELYVAHIKGKESGLKSQRDLINQMQRRIDYLENLSRRINRSEAIK